MDKTDDRLWFIDEESETIRQANEKLEEKKKRLSLRYGNVKERIRDAFGR